MKLHHLGWLALIFGLARCGGATDGDDGAGAAEDAGTEVGVGMGGNGGVSPSDGAWDVTASGGQSCTYKSCVGSCQPLQKCSWLDPQCTAMPTDSIHDYACNACGDWIYFGLHDGPAGPIGSSPLWWAPGQSCFPGWDFANPGCRCDSASCRVICDFDEAGADADAGSDASTTADTCGFVIDKGVCDACVMQRCADDCKACTGSAHCLSRALCEVYDGYKCSPPEAPDETAKKFLDCIQTECGAECSSKHDPMCCAVTQ